MTDPVLDSIPDWLKYVATGAGGIGATLLALRQWLSQAKVDRTGNEANIAAIQRLESQLEAANKLAAEERARADDLMHEREAMATEIGSLRGEVKGLRAQVEMLMKLVEDIRDQRAPQA